VRHIRVISPDDLPHFDGGSLDFQYYKGHIQGAICLSPVSFFSGLTTLLAALCLTVFLLTVQCLREKRRMKTSSVHTMYKNHTIPYQNHCDEPRLSPLFYVQ
jgi:hypothetical protein